MRFLAFDYASRYYSPRIRLGPRETGVARKTNGQESLQQKTRTVTSLANVAGMQDTLI